MSLLQVDGVSKAFGRLLAVNRVSFRVEEGEVRAIIGPNGAGKTTLFALVSGLIRPDEGRVYFRGKEVTYLPPHLRVRLGMARTFQVPQVLPELTVEENFRIGVETALGLSSRLLLPSGLAARVGERVAQLLDRLRLEEKAKKRVGVLSHGDQRIVEIGLALSLGATLLLLDEPTAGMSDEETLATVRLIRELREKEGVTVVFIEHDMRVVFGIADRITVLHLGEVLAEGTLEDVARDERVQAAYLGTEGVVG